jgi:hypothetical protein
MCGKMNRKRLSKHKAKNPFRRSTCKWEDNITMNVKGMWCDCSEVNWSCSGFGTLVSSYERRRPNKTLGYVIRGVTVRQLRYSQIIKILFHAARYHRVAEKVSTTCDELHWHPVVEPVMLTGTSSFTTVPPEECLYGIIKYVSHHYLLSNPSLFTVHCKWNNTDVCYKMQNRWYSKNLDWNLATGQHEWRRDSVINIELN